MQAMSMKLGTGVRKAMPPGQPLFLVSSKLAEAEATQSSSSSKARWAESWPYWQLRASLALRTMQLRSCISRELGLDCVNVYGMYE